MKKFMLLTLFVSVFAVSSWAQIRSCSWSKRYDAEMEPFARVTFVNTTSKTITNFVVILNRYHNGTPEYLNERKTVTVYDASPYSSSGYAYVWLIPKQYEESRHSWDLKIVRIRYSDGTYNDVNISVQKK